MAYPKVNLRKIKRKKGTSWMIDYAVEGKRFRRIVEGNKHTAEQIRLEIQRRLSLGQFDIFRDKPAIIPFELLYNEYKLSKKNFIRKTSLKRYENYSERFIKFMKENFPDAFMDISKITSIHVKECLDDSMEGNPEEVNVWTRKTANGLRAHLKTIFDFATSKKYLAENPVDACPKYPIASTKKVEFFTDEQLTSIWETVEKQWRPFLEFILHTGLRKGEAMNLTWDNVNLNPPHPTITIISRKDWQTKTGQHRTIPLNSRAVEILQAQSNKEYYVFLSSTGKKVLPDDPYHALKKALSTLKLKGDVHKLRHTFASILVMGGETLYTVGKLLGHTDPKTTQIYAHLSPDHLRGAVDKMISD